MTLNQFAWEMWERLGYEGVDPSVLSRVLSGKRLFTSEQLQVFIGVIKIKEKEKTLLEEIWHKSLLERFGINYERELSVYDYLDIIKNNIPLIRRLKDSGNALVAHDFVQKLIDLLNLMRSKSTNILAGEEFSKVLTILYWEMGHIKTLFLTKNDVLNKSLKDWNSVNKINKVLRNSEISNNLRLGLGFTYYVKEDYRESAKLLSASINENVDPELNAWLYKMLALDYAYLGERKNFVDLLAKIPKIIENQKLSKTRLCELLEGIYRGSALLDLPESENYLELGTNVLEKMQKTNQIDLFRNVQFVRGQLEVESHRHKKGIFVNKSNIENLGLRGLELSRTLGLKRHSLKIKTFLEDILD